ncbi:MAG: family 16 glycosylhydrolase [Planctomycetota bacterium]
MRAILRIPVALLLGFACQACAPKETLAMDAPPPQFLPKEGAWEPMPALCDEFEGAELDAAKWHPNNPRWKGRQPGWFHTANVAVRDGTLHLTMKAEDLRDLPEGYHTFTSAAVQSKTRVRYGYFEIRSRAMDSKGSSAFWFYDHTPEIWTEIDVFEMGAGHPRHERIVHMNVHVFHTLVNPDRHWAKPEQWRAPWRLADGFHVYGLQWGPQQLKFFIDGQCVRTTKNSHWHQPLTLNFDSETMPKWFGLPDPENLPSTFSIDYIRSWRRTDPPYPVELRRCNLRFPDAKPETIRGKHKTWRLKTDGDGILLVHGRFNRQGKPGRLWLEYDHPAFYQAQRAASVGKTIIVKDKAGQPVAFTFHWTKVKDEKAHHGYRATRVDIGPPRQPQRGRDSVHEFLAESGETVRLTLSY